MTSDYVKYRGKCKEYSESFIEENPELDLRLVRGHYDCPLWGEQPHWWCEDKDGKIYDPTVAQFPTKGGGANYIEFNGKVKCEQCGKEITEDEIVPQGNYPCCSIICCKRLVGI